MVTLCIECKKIVNKCQEALRYDGCNKWQHRTCRRGVSGDAIETLQKRCQVWRRHSLEMQTLFHFARLFVNAQLFCMIFLSTALSPKKSDRAQRGDQTVESPFLEPPDNSNQKSFPSSVKSCNISEFNWKYGQIRLFSWLQAVIFIYLHKIFQFISVGETTLMQANRLGPCRRNDLVMQAKRPGCRRND